MAIFVYILRFLHSFFEKDGEKNLGVTPAKNRPGPGYPFQFFLSENQGQKKISTEYNPDPSGIPYAPTQSSCTAIKRVPGNIFIRFRGQFLHRRLLKLLFSDFRGRCPHQPFVQLAIATIVIFFSQNATAQDVHFSQFFEAPMLRNPALAGIFAGDLRFQAIYRHQWASVAVPYKTGSFNMDYKMPIGSANDFLTIGGQVVYDKAGSSNFKTTQILPAVNYHKSLSDDKNRYLSLGFMGGYVQRSIDPAKVTTDNQFTGAGYNPAMATGETLINYSLGYWDGSVGLSFNTGFGQEENNNNNLFLGIAYHHFNRPKNSFYRNPGTELSAKWVYSLGLRFGMDERSYFTLHADYNKQGSFQEIIGGVMYTMALDDQLENAQYKLGLGGFMRWKDAIIPVIKLDYKALAVAFSYDVNTSLLKTASQGRGGFEISVTHTSFFDRENSTRNAVRCPRF